MIGITYGTEITEQGNRLHQGYGGGGGESGREIRPRLVLSSPFCFFNLTLIRRSFGGSVTVYR